MSVPRSSFDLPVGHRPHSSHSKSPRPKHVQLRTQLIRDFKNLRNDLRAVSSNRAAAVQLISRVDDLERSFDELDLELAKEALRDVDSCINNMSSIDLNDEKEVCSSDGRAVGPVSAQVSEAVSRAQTTRRRLESNMIKVNTEGLFHPPDYTGARRERECT